MKPSDLFIRGRQFFGFLIPGMMWAASVMFVRDEHPLAVVEGGNPFIRSALFIGISYIMGFIIQTLIFPLTADVLKKLMNKRPSKRIKKLKKLEGQITEIFKAMLPGQEEWLVPADDFRSFCKLYVLEHSPTVGSLLLEKEDDINFMVANLVSLPVLVFTWMYRHPSPVGWKVPIILTVVFALALLKRLYFYLQQETVYAYEACLMLLLKQREKQTGKAGHDKAPGKAESGEMFDKGSA